MWQGSNESSDDEEGPSRQSPYSDADTEPGITDPGVTEGGTTDFAYPDDDSPRRSPNDPMMSMGSTAFWDPPELQYPANSNKVLDTQMSDAGTGNSTDPSQGGSSASANTVYAKPSPGMKRIARVRKRHLGMLQTMLEASRRAAEFVTSVRYCVCPDVKHQCGMVPAEYTVRYCLCLVVNAALVPAGLSSHAGCQKIMALSICASCV